MSPKIGAGVHTLLFDLDGTLYPIENGYEKAVRDRVFEFMVDELKVESIESAKEQWWTHFKAYNQTLRALRAGLWICEAPVIYREQRPPRNLMVKKIYWNVREFNRLRKKLEDTPYGDFVNMRRVARADVLAAAPEDLRTDFPEPPA